MSPKYMKALLIAGVGMVCGAGAATLVVTTGDCGDGTPGKGADGWVSENSEKSLKTKPGTGKMSKFVMVRANATRQDTGYFRFDLSDLKGRKVQSATFKLYFMGDDRDRMSVFGLKDGVKGTNRAGGEDVNDADADKHDEFWIEKLLDRESAPGMLEPDGDLTTVDWNEDAIVFLGEICNGGEPGLVELTSADVALFVNNDSNGVVTFMMQGAQHSCRYASKEDPDGNPPATLELILAK
ncbi:hypothetical protein [Tichowtungia aerotolerans]|uniref:Uncharacterized protein n=1 Tax=Tichowtungia aerotolerans TaxID=2697043 RepID=A0A6P1MF34_9BACT|nr:hypothetical protein [Tichowtungia aerotolerans]QHI70618.1 hypothetical protein GT409_14610 [Tichowtungia aerotolerans]